MYLVKTPKLIQNLFPHFVWKIPTEEKRLFLTFDDGPIPEVTPWVLDQLAQYGAKATFFCVGENVTTHQHIFEKILAEGHSCGSHTFNHLSGWSTDNLPYFFNVRKGASMTRSNLFRPPYGRMKPSQINFLMRHYQIIMWDVLSGDFDSKLSKEQCLENVMLSTNSGSIIVLHDSLKSQEKLEYVLPKVLAHFSELGYSFDAIMEHTVEKPALVLRSA